MADLFATLTDFARQEHEKFGVPGFSLAVRREGAVRPAGLGVTMYDHWLPVTAYALFRIGSITRTLAGMLIMHLEMDKLLLPHQAHLPGRVGRARGRDSLAGPWQR